MTTVAPGRRASSGTSTWSRKARNTGVEVAASTLVIATTPSRPNAASSATRRQPPHGTAPRRGPARPSAPGPEGGPSSS